MKAEYLKPFIESITEVFESMLGSPVKVERIGIPDKSSEKPEIIGLIGLSGSAQGIVAVKLPENTALALISRMVGADFNSIDSSVIDGVGELVNIIAGNAKAKFTGHMMSLSLPTVVRGSIYKLKSLEDFIWIAVFFESEFGKFSMEVSFKPAKTWEKESANAGVNSR